MRIWHPTTSKSRWRDLLRLEIRPAIIVGFWLAILIYLSGINIVIDHAPRHFSIRRMDAALLLLALTVSAGTGGFHGLLVVLLFPLALHRLGQAPTFGILIEQYWAASAVAKSQ